MTDDEKISLLEMVTGYSREYLKSLDSDKLDKLFKERYEQ